MSAVNASTKQQFAERLSRARQERSEATITNRFPWQTRAAFLELLDLASSESWDVRILTGTATTHFYHSDVAKRIEECLDRGSRVYILRLCKGKEWSPALTRLAAEYRDHVQLRAMDVDPDEIRRLELPHFLLIDKSAYRLEAFHDPDHCDGTFSDVAPETRARICFNDAENGQLLHDFFERLWKLAPSQSESNLFHTAQ